MTDEKDLPEDELDADKPSALLSSITTEGAERLVPVERDWSAIEETLFARIDAGEPSEQLVAVTAEASERLVPADRDWSAIEDKLLARIDAEIESDAPSEALAEITRESKTHLVPEADFSAIEKKLHRRLDAERKIAPLPIRWRGVIAASAIAAAAAAVVFAGKSQTTWTDPGAHSQRTAGALGVHDGSVRIGGSLAAVGQAAQAGDRVEVGAGRATFDQTGRVTWALEPQTRARVTRTEGGLVLALEQGATEAQVVPVPSGEAFAVDIADSSGRVARVAVHGTHLRVARAGDHVVVDLTEGVVTVGRAPRAGSTYGTLVTAPAHVEFDVADVENVHVDHMPTGVRPAVVLAWNDKPAAIAQGAQPQPYVAMAPVDIVDIEGTKPEPRFAAPQVVEVKRPDNTPEPGPVEPDAVQKVDSAVHACFVQGASQHPEGSPEVHISVSTDLRLPVGADSQVHTFEFTHPLSKSEQDCVGKTIFGMRFPEADKTVVLHFDLNR